MNILLVTGHPAQVHNFKYVKKELERSGHTVYWLASNKDISNYLLNKYHIEYSSLNKGGRTYFSKLKSLIYNTIIAWKFIKKNNINIVVSRVSPYASIACWLLRKPHIGLTDTESAGVYDKIFGNFLSSLLTAQSFQRSLRRDQIRFNGNIELFYLHPNRFSPRSRKEVAKLLGIDSTDEYILMRFVSWDAYHDKGLQGFTDKNKIKAVQAFTRYAKVFISAEKELPETLEPYKIRIPPEKMHDVMAHASMFFGESGTMASESATLGTPAIYLNKNWLGYLMEEYNSGLLFAYKQSTEDQLKAIKKGVCLLSEQNIVSSFKIKHKEFLKKKIDVTAFLVWFIENYPESSRIMEENPDYQYKFK